MKLLFAQNDAALIESLLSSYDIDLDIADFLEEEVYRRLQADIFQSVYMSVFKHRLTSIDKKGELTKKVELICDHLAENFHFNYTGSCFDTNEELVCEAVGIKGKRKQGFIAYALDF